MLKVMADSKHAQQSLHQLTCQKTPEIAVDAKYGDQEKYKEKAYQQTDHAVGKGKSRFAKSV